MWVALFTEVKSANDLLNSYSDTLTKLKRMNVPVDPVDSFTVICSIPPILETHCERLIARIL